MSSAAPTATATQASTVATAEPARFVLRLRRRRQVNFDDTAVDNEHHCKHKSNKCCIFHKPREMGDSSDESDYSSDSD